MRLTTRLSHSRANVEVGTEKLAERVPIKEGDRRFVLLPAIAQKNYVRLCGKQAAFQASSMQPAFCK